jgi:hypothetical protein
MQDDAASTRLSAMFAIIEVFTLRYRSIERNTTMKAICYLTVGFVYAIEGANGHGVIYFVLGFLYGAIAYAEWTHRHKINDESHGS